MKAMISRTTRDGTYIIKECDTLQNMNMLLGSPRLSLGTTPSPNHGRVWNDLPATFQNGSIPKGYFGTSEINGTYWKFKMLNFAASLHGIDDRLDIVTHSCCHPWASEAFGTVQQATKQPSFLV